METEEKARKMGWVPEDEWTGAPEKWRPAEEFVERGENIVPILRDRLEKFEKDLEIIVKTQKSELERARKEEREKAENEYKLKLDELKKRELEAVKESDTAAYLEVQDEKKKVEEARKKVDAPPDPVFEDWHKKNPWYAPDLSDLGGADEDLTLFANSVGGKIRHDNPAMPLPDFYKAVEDRVRQMFPHKFENPNREKDDVVATSTHSGKVKGKKKGFSDLPAEAKKSFERARKRIEKVGGKLTEEDYANEYWSEE